MEGTPRLLNREQWAKEQFGESQLGDRRRTRRLVKVAAQMAANSSGSIPQQAGDKAAMKATYRLFAADDVTHEAVCEQHWRQTRAHAGTLSTTFFVSDVCTLSFLGHFKTEGLGPIHSESDLGLHQLNVLAVDPATKRPFGLAWQYHFCRELRPADQPYETWRKRPLSARESYVWNRGIRELGTPPPERTWVHVIDRGGDEFTVFDETRRVRSDFIIRLCNDRRIEPMAAGPDHLFEYVRSIPAQTTRQVTIPQRNGPPREVTLCIAAGRARIRPPKREPELRSLPPIDLYVVRAWDADAPKGEEGIEWILGTSLNVLTTCEPESVVDGYSLRWIVEEFHKALKTGCAVEERRLEHTDRLEPLIGVLSILAVYLLQLKYVARENPDTPARDCLDDEPIQLMAAYLRRPAARMSMGQFWQGIGRLGGHMGRKCDGPIGWLRAWRGWQAFQLMLLGATLTNTERRGQKCG